MSTFSDRFKEMRIRKKLTQQEIADKFMLDKSSISKYESGKQVPEITLLLAFADFFEVSLDHLMGRNEIEANYNEKESFVIDLLSLLVKQGKIEKFEDLTEHQRKMIEAAINQQIEEINKGNK